MKIVYCSVRNKYLSTFQVKQAAVRFQVSPCEICGGQSGTEINFSPIDSVFPCQHYNTNVPYSF
jgi:hypothetical protein